MPIPPEVYDRTLGSLFDYRGLATQIASSTFNDNRCAFVDMGCGTGNLLGVLDASRWKILIGLDTNLHMLRIARKKTTNGHFVACDARYASKTLAPPKNWNGLVWHLGFCFFNGLARSARHDLLVSLREGQSVLGLVFEIQNAEFCNVHYGQHKQTSRTLEDGIELSFVSKRINSTEPARKLYIHCAVQGQRFTQQSILFDWQEVDVARELTESGWDIVNLVPAIYRGSVSDMPSHWFVTARAGAE